MIKINKKRSISQNRYHTCTPYTGSSSTSGQRQRQQLCQSARNTARRNWTRSAVRFQSKWTLVHLMINIIIVASLFNSTKSDTHLKLLYWIKSTLDSFYFYHKNLNKTILPEDWCNFFITNVILFALWWFFCFQNNWYSILFDIYSK